MSVYEYVSLEQLRYICIKGEFLAVLPLFFTCKTSGGACMIRVVLDGGGGAHSVAPPTQRT